MTKPLVVVLLLLTLGCSNPRNHPLPSDIKTAADDPKFKAVIEKLPQDDRELLASYMARGALGKMFGADVSGAAKTVGEAITAQKKFLEEQKAKEAAQKALAEKVAAERAAAMKAMDDVLTVALIDKKVVPKDMYANRYHDMIAITVAFQNKGAKPLAGVKGRLVFKDIFGDTIKGTGLKVDDEIAAGKTYVWNGSMEVNQFISSDTKLASTPQGKLKTVWEPDTYLFGDGTSLTAPAGSSE